MCSTRGCTAALGTFCRHYWLWLGLWGAGGAVTGAAGGFTPSTVP
jgi:hypothetical protein